MKPRQRKSGVWDHRHSLQGDTKENSEFVYCMLAPLPKGSKILWEVRDGQCRASVGGSSTPGDASPHIEPAGEMFNISSL